jgi:hypothetical protein
MPETAEAERAASIDPISSERPINGHDKRTFESVRATPPDQWQLPHRRLKIVV